MSDVVHVPTERVVGFTPPDAPECSGGGSTLMSPRKAEHNKAVDTWVSDPLARLLFVNGPPMPARTGDQPPIPFASLDEMREVWLEVREQILASMGSSGQVPWAEREWGNGP